MTTSLKSETPENKIMAETIVDHSSKQQELFEEMMAIITDPEARRFSKSSITNINFYITAHQKLMSSLIRDIESGRIGKRPRKYKLGSKKKTSNQPLPNEPQAQPEQSGLPRQPVQPESHPIQNESIDPMIFQPAMFFDQ